MAHTTHLHPVSREHFLGLRDTPGRLALWVFRLPLGAYEHGWGRVLGRTFLRLVHVGRRTGRERSTVAMVLASDPGTHEAVICSGWGPEADWIRNLRAGPAVRVDIGRETFRPQHRFLTPEEAFAVATDFRRRHPHRMRFISWVVGWGDLRSDDAVRAFVEARPFVALRPATHSEDGSNAPVGR
jgi:deazaflavin-dependent oxidoreductase (nitroreductase family)